MFNTFVCADVTKVVVFDGKFKQIKVIENEHDLTEFNKVWHSKINSASNAHINWSKGFKLDITEQSKSNRWLYHPNGWAKILTMNVSSLYKVSNNKLLNSIIGVESSKE